MKYFAILDLSDSGDGICAIEFNSEEEAFSAVDGYGCPHWVAVEVSRPTPRALDLRPCGHSYQSTVLNTTTGETYCGECAGASQYR